MEETTTLMSIYLDNLSYEVTKEDLDEVFRKHKLIKPAYIKSE